MPFDKTEEKTPKHVPASIDFNTIEEYRKKFGNDRTQGYIDAISDMMNDINHILTGVHTTEEGWYVPTRPWKVRTMLTNFSEEKNELLSEIKNANQETPKSSPDDLHCKAN